MRGIDIRAINLNLLPALEALLVEGSVSGAARRMHVSQSAMSHSLAKLRELLGDPILVPVGRRLVPSPRSAEMISRLPAALDALRRAIEVPAAFDPRREERVFRLATLDYFELTTLPEVLEYLRVHAPRVVLEIERFGPSTLPSLAAGDVDLALVGSSLALPPSGLRRVLLFEDPFVVLARADHPSIGKKLDLGTYLSLGHVLVSVEGQREGVVDRALAKLGKTRRIALRVPHFVSAPLAVRSSDHVVTIARAVAEQSRALFGLRIHPPPLAIPPAGVVALWSKRRDDDPGSRWFRELFTTGRALPAHARREIRKRQAEAGR
jgi:DNA-binding transcriptional LysR family regulator